MALNPEARVTVTGGGSGVASTSASLAVRASMCRRVSSICSGESGGRPASASAALIPGSSSASPSRRAAEKAAGEKVGVSEAAEVGVGELAEDADPEAGEDGVSADAADCFEPCAPEAAAAVAAAAAAAMPAAVAAVAASIS